MKILITGATNGHGRYLAEKLAPHHDLLLHGRDPQRTAQLATEIGAMPFVADLSNLAQVRRLAADIESVDVLINNAGIGYGKERQVSPDGYELRLAVMYLAPVLLARLLKVSSHVLNVGSLGQAPVDFDDLQMEHTYDGLTAYRRAKLALVMATFDMAVERPDIRVNVVHPATYMDTNMVRGGGGTPLHTVVDGGENTLRVLQTPMTGTFFNEDKPGEAHPDTYRIDLRSRLRDATDTMLR